MVYGEQCPEFHSPPGTPGPASPQHQVGSPIDKCNEYSLTEAGEGQVLNNLAVAVVQLCIAPVNNANKRRNQHKSNK
jgi:hypothetical protein